MWFKIDVKHIWIKKVIIIPLKSLQINQLLIFILQLITLFNRLLVNKTDYKFLSEKNSELEINEHTYNTI